jgi:putative phage-type endonuclease
VKRLEKIPVQEMSREDWLMERRHSIGGSDVGALLGLNRYRSPYTVWAEKTGLLPEQPDNEAMRQGRDLEDYVTKRFVERSGKQVSRYNYLLRSSDCPHLHANIDRRVLGERSGLECKTASALNMKAYAGGQFPESYYAQCVSYLAVTGWKRWYLAALVLNRAFFIYQLTTIEDDAVPDWCDGSVYVPGSEISALKELAADFWERYVETGDPPPVDGSDSTTESIKAIFREDNGGEIELFGREGSLAAYSQLLDAKKDIERRIDEIKQLLMQDMGSAAKARCGQYKLSWAGQERRTLDVAKVKKSYPDIRLDDCYKTTYVRPFKITEEKVNG